MHPPLPKDSHCLQSTQLCTDYGNTYPAHLASYMQLGLSWPHNPALKDPLTLVASFIRGSR
jgi:hypothetical protein